MAKLVNSCPCKRTICGAIILKPCASKKGSAVVLASVKSRSEPCCRAAVSTCWSSAKATPLRPCEGCT